MVGIMQVVAFTAEEIVRFFGNHHKQVAASATARTAVAFATEVQVLAFAHACRNLDGDFFALLDAAFAVAVRARIGDHLASATASGAGAFGNHLEESTRHATHATRAMAGATFLDVRTALAVTFRTRRIAF